MPQELQSTNQATTEEVNQTTTVTANKNKAEQKQNKNDDINKSLKRTAPTDVASQGDAKRKATQGSKKSSDKQIENANLKATDPTTIAANAAAILSSVPSSVAQNVGVAPLIPNQQTPISELSHSNMEDYLNNTAATAQTPTQAQPQDNSGIRRAASTRNLTNDERRQRRLLRNRVAAKECRRKKKAYVADLEEKVTRLEEENNRLNKEIDELNTKLELNGSKLEENARLHKEIEELKAKLNTTQQQGVQKSKTNNAKEEISTDA